eukprot:gene11291-23626_t
MSDSITLQNVTRWVEENTNHDQVIEAIRTNPKWIVKKTPGSTGNVLERIVVSGNLDLLKRILEASRTSTSRGTILSPESLRINSSRTLLDAARENRVANPAMYDYIRDLSEWDATCEIAKQHISTQANRLWATLRRHSSWCYTAPPTRRWSISMQVVYYGDTELFQYMLQICPPPAGKNIWGIRSNDNMTMLDAVTEVAEPFPVMFRLVRDRTEASHRASAPVLIEENTLAADISRVADSKESDSETKATEHVVAETPTTQIDTIRAQWPDILAATVRRGRGKCCILETENVDLFRTSRDCHHSAGAEGLRRYLEGAIRRGPFPIHCPVCATSSPLTTGKSGVSDRGIVTRSILKGLVEADVISLDKGRLLLLEQVRSLPDEPSIDFQYGMSKPCPVCSTPIAHYKGHGCHHIRPGSGCPSCQNHFCYSCLSSTGKKWTSCPNKCPLFCHENCDCPTCLDCSPGKPCDVCDGCPACRRK